MAEPLVHLQTSLIQHFEEYDRSKLLLNDRLFLRTPQTARVSGIEAKQSHSRARSANDVVILVLLKFPSIVNNKIGRTSVNKRETELIWFECYTRES